MNRTNSQSIKVCFVSLNIYPVFIDSSLSKKMGGAELQQVFLAKALKSKGYSVSFITSYSGQKDDEEIDGISIFKTYRNDEGIPVLRFLYPRLIKIWAALKRANADVYYVRTAGFLAGVVAFFVKRHHKKFVFAGAHDTDFIPEELLIRTTRDKMLYKYGLRNADLILVQTEKQLRLLNENFQLHGKVIRSLSDGEVGSNLPEKKKYILWVSTIRDWKRPHYFLELAKNFERVDFLMIGGADTQNPLLFEEVSELCSKIKNIEFLGFQTLKSTEAYFDEAKVFVNTSVLEGFPNTFLQAWRRGIPVITFFDPDGVVKEKKLGYVVTTQKALGVALQKILSGESSDISEAEIIKYFRNNHSFDNINKFCELIEGVV